MIKITYDSYILLGARPGAMTQIVDGWSNLPPMAKVEESMALFQHMGPTEGFCLVRPSNILAPLKLAAPAGAVTETDSLPFSHNDNMDVHLLDKDGDIRLWRIEHSRQKGDLLSVTLRRKQ
jgi:hypothetical protein